MVISPLLQSAHSCPTPEVSCTRIIFPHNSPPGILDNANTALYLFTFRRAYTLERTICTMSLCPSFLLSTYHREFPIDEGWEKKGIVARVGTMVNWANCFTLACRIGLGLITYIVILFNKRILLHILSCMVL